jgi:histidine triad (HIT) family protein
LIIPKRHIATINDITSADEETIGKLYVAARDIAAAEGIAEPGYRAVMNCNAAAGQTVFHIHLHLLGGRDLGWPPG